jgi:hypothetical protein
VICLPNDEEGEIREREMIIPENFNSLDEFETWLHHEVCLKPDFRPREYVGIFNPDGTFVEIIIIDQDEISGALIEELSPEQDRLLEGKIVSHNHPSEHTFSYEEVLTCFDLNYSEFRVITPFYTYILKPNNRRWLTRQEIQDWINTHITQQEFEQCIRNPTKRHQLFTMFTNEGFFEYRKEPRFY